MRKCIVWLVILLFHVAAVAADVSGKWIAQITSPSGSTSERVFTFKVSGNKLTGTVVNQQVSLATFEETGKPGVKLTGKITTMGNPQETSEGTISGDDISFVIISKRQEMEIRTIYKGKVSGDEIKFTVETKMPEGMTPPGGQPPRPQEIIAKRASP
jgi:hypothetical protein